MKKDVFNKATKISKNIMMIDQIIDSSDNLTNPNFRGLFNTSLLILIEDDEFCKHFKRFLEEEKKANEEMFNNL